jgi:hypothetical protein
MALIVRETLALLNVEGYNIRGDGVSQRTDLRPARLFVQLTAMNGPSAHAIKNLTGRTSHDSSLFLYRANSSRNAPSFADYKLVHDRSKIEEVLALHEYEYVAIAGTSAAVLRGLQLEDT